MPSTLNCGTAPGGNAPSSFTSTVRVPFSTAGSIRITWPGITSVVRVDGRLLSDLDVFRLRLRNLQRRFQLRRLRHFREHRSLRHLLADVHIQFLQHAVYARPHVQFVNLRLL